MYRKATKINIIRRHLFLSTEQSM